MYLNRPHFSFEYDSDYIQVCGFSLGVIPDM